MSAPTPPTWRLAWQEALYGPGGFYRRNAPAAHFRTSVHASPRFAAAVAGLARAAGAATVVDVGAGRGELLAGVAAADPGLALVAVEVARRPPELPAGVRWLPELPAGLRDVLVVANEWLDDVPAEVVQVDAAGIPRLVRVDPASGAERLGPPVTGPDLEWLAAWWPLAGAGPGTRAEVGRYRDLAWARTVAAVRHGVLLAVDYSHQRGHRPPAGTLTGYRDGRQVAPVPDGSCDVTAHVALDSCAAAGAAAGAAATLLTTQRAALRALGVSGTPPARAVAVADPRAYLAALSVASQHAELLDPRGLGGFGWLLHSVGGALPAPLAALA